MKTLTITVSISPISRHDSSGGTVRCRVPLTFPDSGLPRTVAELRVAAIDRAVRRLYGERCFWWADSGLPGYGQVMRSSRHGGSDAVTYRAGLDVEIPALPEAHVAALRRRAEEEREFAEAMERAYGAGFSDGLAGRPAVGGDDWDYQRGFADGCAEREIFAADEAARLETRERELREQAQQDADSAAAYAAARASLAAQAAESCPGPYEALRAAIYTTPEIAGYYAAMEAALNAGNPAVRRSNRSGMVIFNVAMPRFRQDGEWLDSCPVLSAEIQSARAQMQAAGLLQ